MHPIQWTERPTGALVAAGFICPCLVFTDSPVSSVYRRPWLRCVPFSANVVQPQKHVQSRVPSNTRVLLTPVLHRKQVRRAKETASFLDLPGTRGDELSQLV
jgi:hypothetical protein